MKKTLALLAFAAFSATALAAPPEACEILKPEDINPIAVSKVERVQKQKSGNPTQCGFLDSRKASVLVLSIREVRYAVKDELHEEKSQLEKIYKTRAKQLGFRKGKMIVNVTFSLRENQSEVDTSQIARIVESRLPKQ